MTDQPTAVIHYTSTQYIKLLFSAWFARNCVWLLIPLLVCAALAFVRWEWIVVGLMILLIIYPFVLFNLFLKYGTKVENLRYIKPFTIHFSQHAVVIKWDDGEKQVFKYSDVKKVYNSKKGIKIGFNSINEFIVFIKDADWLAEGNKDSAIALLLKNGTKFAGEE